MINKQLEEEHSRAALDYIYVADMQEPQIWQAHSSITLEHMKGFREFLLESGAENETSGWLTNSEGKSVFFESTEQLIDLYFESLNKKT